MIGTDQGTSLRPEMLHSGSRGVAGRLLNDEEFRSKARAALEQASDSKMDALRRVKLLNECFEQGTASMSELGGPAPQLEASRTDSDLSESSSADSDISDGEGADCIAALQSALQQRAQEEARAKAALVLQAYWRGFLARREAEVQRQILQLARANKQRRIVAAAFTLYHRQHLPGLAWLRQLLRKGVQEQLKHRARKRLRPPHVERPAGPPAGQILQQANPAAQLAATECQTGTLDLLPQAATLEPQCQGCPAPADRPAATSSACQTVCEAGCQTEAEQPQSQGAEHEAVWGGAIPVGGFSRRSSLGALARPPSAVAVGEPQALIGRGVPELASNKRSSELLAAQPSLFIAGHAPSNSRRPSTSLLQQSLEGYQANSSPTPPGTQSSIRSKVSASSSPAVVPSKSRDRSSSIQKSIETVQVALESTGSVASLAALQVCEKVKESAAHAAPVQPPLTARLAKRRSVLARPDVVVGG